MAKNKKLMLLPTFNTGSWRLGREKKNLSFFFFFFPPSRPPTFNAKSWRPPKVRHNQSFMLATLGMFESNFFQSWPQEAKHKKNAPTLCMEIQAWFKGIFLLSVFYYGPLKQEIERNVFCFCHCLSFQALCLEFQHG